MRRLTIGGEEKEIPVIWSEMTADQFQKLYRENYDGDKVKNHLKMIAVLCGMDAETLSLAEYDAATQLELEACVAFLQKPMVASLRYSVFECMGEKIRFEPETAAPLSVGQAFAIRDYYEANKFRNFESMITFPVAVYVAGAKRITSEFLEKAEEEIKTKPIRDVCALAFFLSKKCLSRSSVGSSATSKFSKILLRPIAMARRAWNF